MNDNKFACHLCNNVDYNKTTMISSSETGKVIFFCGQCEENCFDSIFNSIDKHSQLQTCLYCKQFPYIDTMFHVSNLRNSLPIVTKICCAPCYKHNINIDLNCFVDNPFNFSGRGGSSGAGVYGIGGASGYGIFINGVSASNPIVYGRTYNNSISQLSVHDIEKLTISNDKK